LLLITSPAADPLRGRRLLVRCPPFRTASNFRSAGPVFWCSSGWTGSGAGAICGRPTSSARGGGSGGF